MNAGLKFSNNQPLRRCYTEVDEELEFGFRLRRCTTKGPDGRMVDIIPWRRRESLSKRFRKSVTDLARKGLEVLRRKSAAESVDSLLGTSKEPATNY